jgi:hypothetical protein
MNGPSGSSPKFWAPYQLFSLRQGNGEKELMAIEVIRPFLLAELHGGGADH